MQMNPYDYYDIFVQPNYDDFCDDEGSVRKAFNAVVSIVHMADNYFYYFKKQNDPKVSSYGTLKNFHIYLSKQSSYFNDVQSIANAYKHLYTNSGKAYVTVASGGAVGPVKVSEGEVTVIDEAQQEDTREWVVIYEKKDGIKIRLKTAIDDVLKMWQGLI